jgi:hypothetical protein
MKKLLWRNKIEELRARSNARLDKIAIGHL